MAILDFEGFDQYSDIAAQFHGRFYRMPAGASLVTGRDGAGKSLRVTANTGTPLINFRDPLTTPAGRVTILGCAIFLESDPVDSDRLITFQSSNGQVSQVTITRSRASGQMRFHAGASTSTPVLASTVSVPVGSWFYLEVKITWGLGVAGSVSIRIDGVPAGSVEGVATYSSNSWNIGCVTFEGGGSTVPVRYDDYYLADNTGPSNNDFLGPRRVIYLPANSTAFNDMQVTGAPTAHEAVGGAVNDATYISSNVVGARGLFGNSGVGTSGISAVRPHVRGKKEVAGSRGLRGVLVSGGVTRNGAAVIPGEANFQSLTAQTAIVETDPATGAAWTASGVSAATAGVEIL